MDNTLERDCAVCLQKCHHPTQLPCGHIFCFLCVKGVAIQSKKCAMCRAEIPPDYLDNPVLLEKLSPEQVPAEETSEEYQWYYEGRNGWWKYDERSNTELEGSFNSGATECMLLLAGALYRIDFQSMIQMRRSDPTRRRRVKRDVPTLPAKGVAGIKILDNTPPEQAKSENEEDSVIIVNSETEDEVIEIEDDSEDNDNNESPPVNDVHEISNTFSAISLQETQATEDYPAGEDT